MDTIILTIRKDNTWYGDVSYNQYDHTYTTDGTLGHNTCNNIPDLFRILMGHGISIDDHVFF